MRQRHKRQATIDYSLQLEQTFLIFQLLLVTPAIYQISARVNCLMRDGFWSHGASEMSFSLEIFQRTQPIHEPLKQFLQTKLFLIRARLSPEDILQDVFLDIEQKQISFSGLSDREMCCWLRNAVIWKANSALRYHLDIVKRSSHKETSLDDIRQCSTGDLLHKTCSDRPEAEETEEHLWQYLQSAMSDLCPVKREILELRYLECWEIAQLAIHFGLTPTSTRRRLSRAVAQLRKMLKANTELTALVTLPERSPPRRRCHADDSGNSLGG